MGLLPGTPCRSRRGSCSFGEAAARSRCRLLRSQLGENTSNTQYRIFSFPLSHRSPHLPQLQVEQSCTATGSCPVLSAHSESQSGLGLEQTLCSASVCIEAPQVWGCPLAPSQLTCCLPMKPGFSLNTEGILRRVQKIPGRPRRCSRPSFRCTGRGGSYCSQGSLILIQLGSHSHLQGVSRHPTERQEGQRRGYAKA